MTNFRGVEKVLMISVLEGDGTEENPYEIRKYIVSNDMNNTVIAGKVEKLSEEEKRYIRNNIM